MKNHKLCCRTCESKKSKPWYPLKTLVYPEKKVADLLTEIAKIDLRTELEDSLPQEICCNCSRRLKKAYDFVCQAKATNFKLLNALERRPTSNNDSKNSDCLQEAPIEIKEERDENSIYDALSAVDVEIKEEGEVMVNLNKVEETIAIKLTDNENEDDLFCCSFCHAKILDKNAYNEHIEFHTSKENCKINPDIEVKEAIESLSIIDPDDVPLAMRRRMSAYRKRKTKTENRLESKQHDCPHCNRKFGRLDKLKLHMKSHRIKLYRNAANRGPSCMDERLCKPHGCKLIQCMICLLKLSKFSELRLHLRLHVQSISFSDRSESIGEIVEALYPDKSQLTEEELLKHIIEDLTEERFARFYSITNEAGFELSIDSSETESDSDQDMGNGSPFHAKCTNRHFYTCDICKSSFNRKYKIFEHHKNHHNWEDAKHVCMRCNARFLCKELLQHHYKLSCKNTQKRFFCSRCPLRFRWKHNLKSHFSSHGIKQRVGLYTCNECQCTFQMQKDLTIHIYKQHSKDISLLNCKWCSRQFYRKENFLHHLKQHGITAANLPLAETLLTAHTNSNGSKVIICKVCNIQFKNIAELRLHITMESKSGISGHHNYKSMQNYSIINQMGFELDIDDSETDDEINTKLWPDKPKCSTGSYICEICRLKCQRKFEMFQHQYSLHKRDVLPFKCEKCVFKCVSKDILMHHMRTLCNNMEKQLQCQNCNYKFMWEESLELHNRLQHPPETTPLIQSTGTNETQVDPTKILQCPHCDRTYIHQNRLNNHIRDVHTQAPKRKILLCTICGTEFKNSSLLKLHMRSHTGEKPYKCEMCNLSFASSTYLTLHRRIHTGEKPYKCTVCDKDFARSDKLKRHMLIHSGEKPFKCNYCDKSYRQSKDLTLHIRGHTGELPFFCGVCGERFIQSNALKNHRVLRSHFEEGYDPNRILLNLQQNS